MSVDSLKSLIERSLEDALIDAHAIDQDGSNVIIVGDAVHYFSDEDAIKFLNSASSEGREASRPPRNRDEQIKIKA